MADLRILYPFLAFTFAVAIGVTAHGGPLSACPDDDDDGDRAAFCPDDGDDGDSACPDDEDDPKS